MASSMTSTASGASVGEAHASVWDQSSSVAVAASSTSAVACFHCHVGLQQVASGPPVLLAPTVVRPLRRRRPNPRASPTPGHDARMFYFFELRGQEDDPIVIWLRGGPGSSSELRCSTRSVRGQEDYFFSPMD